MSSIFLLPWGTGIPCASRNSLSLLSDQASKSISLRYACALAADADAVDAPLETEALAEDIARCMFRLAWREFRRTDAISLSRVVGCGAGKPRESRNSFRSD